MPARIGGSFHIDVAEQPACLVLDDRALPAERKPACERGPAMQLPPGLA